MDKKEILQLYKDREFNILSKRLKETREKIGYTWDDIKRFLNITTKQIYGAENNKHCRLKTYVEMGVLYGFKFEKLKEIYPDVDFESESFDKKCKLINQKIREYVSDYNIKYSIMEEYKVNPSGKNKLKNIENTGVNQILNYMFFIEYDLSDLIK